MLNTFNNYLKAGKVKKQVQNPEEAKALIEKAKFRLEYSKGKQPNERTAQFVLEDAYEGAREAAQSLMALKGFKPYSHEATISFLKEFHSSSFSQEEIAAFDRFRQLRNNSVYSAAQITEQDSKDCVLFSQKIILKISKMIK